jgi:hypothetical protein
MINKVINKYTKLKMGGIILLITILSGCVGNQQKVNKDIKNGQSTQEPTRDRTPNVPSTNIPSHTF